MENVTIHIVEHQTLSF